MSKVGRDEGSTHLNDEEDDEEEEEEDEEEEEEDPMAWTESWKPPIGWSDSNHLNHDEINWVWVRVCVRFVC